MGYLSFIHVFKDMQLITSSECFRTNLQAATISLNIQSGNFHSIPKSLLSYFLYWAGYFNSHFIVCIVREIITMFVTCVKSIVFYLWNILYQSVYIFGTQAITIGKHILSNAILQDFTRIICYFYLCSFLLIDTYKYFFQFVSISEIILTIINPISYCHTIFRQFQRFKIMHIHEIALISIFITFIIAQFEIFDVRTYLLPRFIFISQQYVFFITYT